MRSHRRRQPVEHVLIAGTAADLDGIRAALAVTSADAYGQVIVQAPADQPLALTAPPRITVHRVDDVPGALTDAVAAWVGEWMPEEPDPARRMAAWIGPHASADLDPVLRGLESSEPF